MKTKSYNKSTSFFSWSTIGVVSFFLCISIVQIIILVYLWMHYPVQERLIYFFKFCHAHFASHAFYVFWAMIILPVFGFPITPFFIMAGSAWGIRWGLTFSLLGIGIGLTFSYFFYRYCLNKMLFRILFKRFNVPEGCTCSSLGSVRWVLIIQLIPGLPYMAQNYILSTIDGINFWHYLSISWIVQFLWAYGFVCGGNDWIRGNLGIKAILLLCFISWGTHRLYKYLQRQKRSHVETSH